MRRKIMKTNKLKIVLLAASLLASGQSYAILESLSKIANVMSATFTDQNNVSKDITKEIRIRCLNEYICKVNMEEILGDNFSVPYTFEIRYDTTKHQDKHKIKVDKTNKYVTIKGYKSHAGTIMRNTGIVGLAAVAVLGAVL